MQDEIITPPPPAARKSGSARAMLLVALAAFLVGGALIGWLAWRGTIPLTREAAVPQVGAPAKLATAPAAIASSSPAPAVAASQAAPAPVAPAAVAPMVVGAVETRLALLEERLSRLDLRAEAASGNASRAEALLIAFAARRAIDRGAPLGYVEDQLRLRFADAQPNAVQTIVDAAKSPVTLDGLLVQLDALGPKLEDAAAREDGWTRIQRELAGLFVIRRDTVPAAGPEDRIARARLMLAAGRVDQAIGEVGRLPGAEGAQAWISSAQRYGAAQRALDLIETTAMLEPRRLQDATGARIEQASPIAGAVPGAAAN